MYNPTKQVATHVYRTAGYLREQGINTWVQGMVYFTNPTITVQLESSKIPVFSEREDGGKEICNYILNTDNKNRLKKEEIDRIVNAINMNLNQQERYYYNNSKQYDNNFNKFNSGAIEQLLSGQAQQLQQQIFWQQGNQQKQAEHQQQVEQQMQQQMQQQGTQHAINEATKSVTPFDHGGYVQGPGFNPSDTMAHNDMMNHMF